MSLIDRGKLLSQLSDLWLAMSPNDRDSDEVRKERAAMCRGIDVVMNIVLQLHTENGWKRGTPDREGIYLVRLSDGRMKFMGYAKNLMELEPHNFVEEHAGWYMDDAQYGIFEVTNVTHWMEMPEPPEEESVSDD